MDWLATTRFGKLVPDEVRSRTELNLRAPWALLIAATRELPLRKGSPSSTQRSHFNGLASGDPYIVKDQPSLTVVTASLTRGISA
jgi:hypothetical protein